MINEFPNMLSYKNENVNKKLNEKLLTKDFENLKKWLQKLYKNLCNKFMDFFCNVIDRTFTNFMLHM